ncbi:hypothetical protein POJ06DRAFT_257673 [Lipomyces tetrasporus]|uniref:Uncharacterized protein n=1 Tax=Lipomyces tetrasporus TaxID=54092 RepID=A0AAD7QNN6_9ASCO|nr:uncharacterized protein POJ06DRAFT_257673 [Lipomyces tetrasporus]KAJ8098675.1 hypothetical protein POJ06DRAFT_257673 [Lipomyces tetrasporus]
MDVHDYTELLQAIPPPVTYSITKASHCPYCQTKCCLGIQFGVNHICYFLFTSLITKKLLKAGAVARVVNVSSDASSRSGSTTWTSTYARGSLRPNVFDPDG